MTGSLLEVVNAVLEAPRTGSVEERSSEQRMSRSIPPTGFVALEEPGRAGRGKVPLEGEEALEGDVSKPEVEGALEIAPGYRSRARPTP